MASDAIKKHKKLYKKANKMIATTSRHHRLAYDEAVGKHLMDDGGYVDMDKLDDSGIQDKFIKSLTDSYIGAAKKTLKSGISGKDQIENDMLMKAYMGVTEKQIHDLIKSSGKNYSFEGHYETMNKALKENITPTLFNAAAAHLKDSDIEGIIKYTKSGDFIDSKKIRVGEAVGLLSEYHEDSQINKKKYKNEVYFKK